MIDGEGQVFEYKQEQYMKGYIRYQYLLPEFRVGVASDGTCRHPAGQDGEQQKKNINRFSAGIKNQG